MEEMNEGTFLTTLKHIVESRGCRILDVDLENHRINIDGPDEAMAECAEAIERLVG